MLNELSIMSLVMAIIGLYICPLDISVVALFFGILGAFIAYDEQQGKFLAGLAIVLSLFDFIYGCITQGIGGIFFHG